MMRHSNFGDRTPRGTPQSKVHAKIMPPKQKRKQHNHKPKSFKRQVVHMSISSKEIENAWRPNVLASSKESTEKESKTQEFYKKVRGVLNKLTPKNFHKLVSEVQELAIDSFERLEGVMNLVYEKAVDETNFSAVYAKMCNELKRKEVQKQDGKVVSFWEILVDRCQNEFKTNIDNSTEFNKEAKLKDIQAETEPKIRAELKFAYEKEERRIKKNSIGNVRFIGELFNIGMLNSHVILDRCVKALLNKENEECLELLCTLLKTIGKKLERELKKPGLSPYFSQIKDFADKNGKGVNVSPRIRFMLQDIIDLQNNNWVPRSDNSTLSNTSGVHGGSESNNTDKRKRKDIESKGSANTNKRVGKNAQIVSPDVLSRCDGSSSFSVKETTEEGNKPLESYKKVRLHLHKDPPENFEKLFFQVQDLANLAFEAVDKPNFASVFAEKCDKLLQGQDEKALLFKKFLINHCQGEIEVMMTERVNKEAKLKEISAETDLDKKKKLQHACEVEQKQIRVNFLCNIRFIGQLFHLGILTAPIMHRCVQGLLNQADDVSLECLCALLTSIEKKLERETIQPGLTPYFTQMKDLSDEKRLGKKVSSDVRCMLKRVIDARKNNFVPHCDSSEAKAMKQIQEETERLTIVIPSHLRSQPSVPQGYERMGRGGYRGTYRQDRRDPARRTSGRFSARGRNH